MSLLDFRLKKEKDFNLVFKKGKRLYSDNFTLIYFPAETLKAGFAVSKKHGGSVVRNRIKRVFRESFRSFTPNLRQNFFFVFIPKVKDEYKTETVKKSMYYTFSKGGFFISDK